MSEAVRVLLVDDHSILRSTMRYFLEQDGGIRVVGEAGTVEEACLLYGELRPDVVLLDVTLPDGSGADACRRILLRDPRARILFLSMHPEREWLIPALEAGAVGYLSKSAADSDLLAAIAQVASGGMYLSHEGMRILASRQRRAQEIRRDEPALSQREEEVLLFVGRGLTSAEIGDRLGLSPHTIDTYRARIKQKLGLGSRAEIVEYVGRRYSGE